MKMGVVADDITGANDIGSMFAKGGYETVVLSYESGPFTLNGAAAMTPEIAILDTDSRFFAPQDAYDAVARATRALMDAGCEHFHKKTCSVFRGNIGREFDAMLDTLGEEFAIVIAGYPHNGRTTVHGIHYVFGRLLEESHFRNDPVHPMRTSNIVEILQCQTERTVALVDTDVIRRGPAVLKEYVNAMRSRCSYLLFDVPDQEALVTIAQATADERVFCGSASIAEELPPVWGARPVPRGASGLPRHENLGILTAAGSLTPVTAGQIRHLADTGMPVLELDTLKLFDERDRGIEIEHLTERITEILRSGQDAVVHTPNTPEAVEATKSEGYRRGLSDAEIGWLVSEAMGEVAAQATRRAGQNRLLVAGGDTSAAVCRHLGVRALRIWDEVQTGLPSCITLTDPAMLLILKAGSMGTPQFMEEALRHLKGE